VETLNNKVVGNAISFVRRVGTQNFDIERKEHEGLKLKRFSRYDFGSESNFLKFLFVFKVRFLMQYECMMPYNMSDLYIPYQKKSSPNIDGVRILSGKIALILVVSSSGITYANVVSVPAEEHNRYMTCITTYLPSGACAFNTARTMLHILREHIHILRKRSQYIHRSPRPRCAVMTSRTTNMQPLPHDRDCLQENLVLRGRVRGSHHPTEGYLPSYLVVGASLQKVNCIK
jgi:hypothetical protein